MTWSTVTATLNSSGLPNVTYTLTTSDYPSAATQMQSVIKNGGFFTNTAVGGLNNQFVPATSILFMTVS